MEEIRLAGINEGSLVDGTGLRYTLFCQGCSHNCEDCFNKSTHDYNGGELIKISTIADNIRKNHLISGVTFSGGECFDQAEHCSDIIDALADMNLNYWAYTGYIFEDIVWDHKMMPFLTRLDVLVDGKFEKDKKDKSLVYCGSSNQRVIDVQKSLRTGEVELWQE